MQQTINALNLRRFAYNNGRAGGPFAAPALPRTTVNKGRVQKSVAGRKTTGKKPRVRANRDARIRSRSTFARAVEHSQRLRGGNA